MARPTVYVIDDEQSVRSSLHRMLGVFGFAVEQFICADSFLEQLPQLGTGCAVADVRMPGTDGIALTLELVKRGSAIPVVLVSGHADIHMAVAAIKAGAEDFIEKPIDDVRLVSAINRGLVRLLDKQNREEPTNKLSVKFARLTPRQVQIFDLVSAGHTSKAIATRLELSRRTVENYRADIMEKMDAECVADLVRQSIALGRAVR